MRYHPADPRCGEVLRTGAPIVHGGGGKGGGSSTTVQKSDPWAGQQPYLQDIFGQAQRLFQAGSTIANPSADTLRAQQMQRSLALHGRQGGLPQAINANTAMMTGMGPDVHSRQLRREARGDFLNANPYLDAMFDQAAGQVGTQFNSLFAGGGRTGSGSHAETLTRGLADMATNIYGANYAQERDRQQLAARTGLSSINQAIGRAPTLQTAEYLPSQILGGIGAQQDVLAQARADQPWANLGRSGGLVQGHYGGTSTTTSPLHRNPAAGLLGGASAGAGIAGTLGLATPWGAALTGAGALLGLL